MRPEASADGEGDIKMKILHITPHMGGGVGTVIMGWMEKVKGHTVVSLDCVNKKAKEKLTELGVLKENYFAADTGEDIRNADIVLVHYWEHPMLERFLKNELPPCRLVFWHHNNLPVPQEIKDYPDLFIGTSPIQGYERHIWSTGDISRFLDIKPASHSGFNIGYVGTIDYKKMHPGAFLMCKEIIKAIPEARFTFVGDIPPGPWVSTGAVGRPAIFTYTGKVDDVAPYLAEMDVFGYPLRRDHYGTCEQALGEAMAAGLPIVVLDNPAEKEIIEHQLSGLVALDEDCYVRSIIHLHKHPHLGRSMSSRHCRIIAKEKYSIDKMVKAWDEVFQEMMEKPKRRHG
jgi:glycosyltransferase involved in cell wall biosynthesis